MGQLQHFVPMVQFVCEKEVSSNGHFSCRCWWLLDSFINVCICVLQQRSGAVWKQRARCLLIVTYFKFTHSIKQMYYSIYVCVFVCKSNTTIGSLTIYIQLIHLQNSRFCLICKMLYRLCIRNLSIRMSSRHLSLSFPIEIDKMSWFVQTGGGPRT